MFASLFFFVCFCVALEKMNGVQYRSTTKSWFVAGPLQFSARTLVRVCMSICQNICFKDLSLTERIHY